MKHNDLWKREHGSCPVGQHDNTVFTQEQLEIFLFDRVTHDQADVLGYF